MFLVHDKAMVMLPDGSNFPIGALEIGHKVKGLYGSNRVIGVRRTEAFGPLWELKGILYGADSGQAFRTQRGWLAIDPEQSNVSAKSLQSGHGLSTSTGDQKVVEGIQGIIPAEHSICVEIELDGDHTFYMNGVLVHNKGESPSSTTNVTKTDPPAYLQPFLTQVASQASKAYGQVPKSPFSGQLIAGPTGAQTQAVQQQKDIAAALGGSGFGQQTTALAENQANKVLSGGYTAPAQNMYQGSPVDTNAVIEASIAPVLRNLQTKVIPQVQSQAIASGAYGSNRADLDLAGHIQDDFTTPASQIAATLGYGEAVRQDEQGFENFKINQQLTPELLKLEQTAALGAPDLFGAGVNQSLLPTQLLGTAGATEQGFNQQGLDEAYQQYLMSIEQPFAGLDQYASILGGVPFGGTSTSTGTGTQQGGGGNMLSGLLGGGLAGYGAASSLAMLNPYTLPITAGGAILGGLLGF